MTAFMLLLAATLCTAFAPEGAKARPLPYTVLIERRLRLSARRARS